MAKVVARFEKVPYEQFEKDLMSLFPSHQFDDNQIRTMWENIETPKRSTWHSAGYDFNTPFDFDLSPGSEIVIPTGIRAVFKEMDWDLDIYPRSGIGFKTGIRLANTVGIIDADYSYANNTGHIMVKLRFDTNPVVSFLMKWGTKLGFFKNTYHFEEGSAFCQGIFRQYGITETDEDEPKQDRTGGMGSTDEQPETTPETPSEPIEEEPNVSENNPIEEDPITSDTEDNTEEIPNEDQSENTELEESDNEI